MQPTSGPSLTINMATATLSATTTSSSSSSSSTSSSTASASSQPSKTEMVAQGTFTQVKAQSSSHARGLSSPEALKKFQEALQKLAEDRNKGTESKKNNDEKEQLPPPPTSRVDEHDVEVEEL